MRNSGRRSVSSQMSSERHDFSKMYLVNTAGKSILIGQSNRM